MDLREHRRWTTDPTSHHLRGTRGGRLPTAAERAAYAHLKNIRVYFQKSAWTDEQFCEEDLLDLARDLVAAGYASDDRGASVWHGPARSAEDPAHEADVHRARYGASLHPPVAALTYCVSPVDHIHVGRQIQITY